MRNTWTVLLFSFLFLNTIAEASEVKFEFKKSLMPSTYKLIINNNDDDRTVEFYGCYNSPGIETNYYVLLKNGSKYYFDSKVFCEIGMKGRYWVNTGSKGVIPFNIGKNLMQNAKQVVFKGVTYIPVRTGSFVESSDMRNLIVVYDVADKKVSFEIGKEVLKQPELGNSLGNLNQGTVESPRGMDINQVDGLFHQRMKIDDYRLRTTEEEN